MISLKTMQTSFTPNRHGLFYTRGLSSNKNPTLLSLCKSNESNSESSQPEGDTRQQEMLARIAMLQTQKVRLADFLDDRSAYLTKFAEEANAEFDQIGEDALRQLDEAGSRIMRNLESGMQEFEESAELEKLEIEQNEKKLADFENQIERDRNEGLFFKNLRKSKPIDLAMAKEGMEKIREVTVNSAGSKTRRNIYLAMIGLVVLGIADSLNSPSTEWQKSVVLGVILVGLLSQLIYEQSMLSKSERTEIKKDGEQE